MARWENVKGNLSFLTTGTDEHGQKVQKEAEKRKMDVKSYCDDVASSFQKELQHYSINIGRFIRTTDPDHVTKVKRVWDSLMANDDLYEDNYRGYYCRSDEAFLTAKQVIEKDGSLVGLSDDTSFLVLQGEWKRRGDRGGAQLDVPSPEVQATAALVSPRQPVVGPLVFLL